MTTDSSPRSPLWRPRGILIVAAAVVLGGVGIADRIRAHSALEEDARGLARPLVRTIHPKRNAGSSELALPGEVRAFVDAPVYARTTGYVTRWFVDLGTEVKAGQVLAELDTPEVDAQFHQAQADLASAEANLALAETTLSRWEELLAIQMVSKQDYEDKAGDLRAKRAARDSARANLARYSQLQDFKRVVAPFHGVITARNVDIGDLVQAGTGAAGSGTRELFHIIDAARLRVYVDLPQSDSGDLRPGVEARIRLPERPGRTWVGHVVRTAGAITPSTRTVRVEVDIDNGDAAVLGGSYAEVAFSVAERSVPRLPVNAILFGTDGPRVATVVGGGTARLVKVALGRDYGTEVEILQGLTGEETVIVNPPDGLEDGAAVQVLASNPIGSRPQAGAG
jgi:RND family efflux transporter MFP subunit